MNYYNENDPNTAAWLTNLIAANILPAGDVDTRSIVDVTVSDLRPYKQHHFFAGIGGWPWALQLIEWPEGLPVWTGSCPCQPFSLAGKQKGIDDPRHLWPEFHRLISQFRPSVVFGEQVAGKAGREWLTGVRSDLETVGYEVGSADLCAAGVGAPHIRQRLYWVSDTYGAGLEGREKQPTWHKLPATIRSSYVGSEGVAKSGGQRWERGEGTKEGSLTNGENAGWYTRNHGPISPDEISIEGLDHPTSTRFTREGIGPSLATPWEETWLQKYTGRSSPSSWDRFKIVSCKDGFRRTEPGTFPLAHGVPGRVGMLRAYGNAIVPELAAEFISAWVETLEMR